MGKVRDFVEAVHVELADERGEVAVFEMSAQDVVCEALGIGDDEGVAGSGPVNPVIALWRADHAIELVEELGKIVLSLVGGEGSC